ncbi:DUF2062 domain-containing protein [Maritimibacter sp. HL-12]|uniref:DUF2062 domain-containing protein n=1 Tax=Maritimibacter sp. HL-12 TaxID=1162418 RepID=UPI000A0F0B5C|nr:DUF2062 domain-containing protein [Maritimibacter sp. HL-12]SMH47886.1 hypothetical protein SAMN05661107_1913 [Maritimibacter sp. HL-12]
MFKRNPRSYARTVLEFFYPRGGWYRAARYVIHRIRRLPDPAHRIARGVSAGVFVCFTPLFGLHFLSAAMIAWVIRGNIFAALLATFFGNPLTFPLIAEVSLRLGSRILDQPLRIHLPRMVEAFGQAAGDLWRNLLTIVFTSGDADWTRIAQFWDSVMLPYLVGGILPGLGMAALAYFLTTPLINAYQKARIKRLRKRYAKRLAESAARADADDEAR